MRLTSILTSALFTSALAACASEGAVGEDGRDDAFASDGKVDGFPCAAEECAAVVHLANNATVDELKLDAGLTARAANNIAKARAGNDGIADTEDDEILWNLSALDDVPYVGVRTFEALLAYAHAENLVGAVPLRPWLFKTLARGDAADFTVNPEGWPVVVMLDAAAGMYQLRTALGSVVPVPADVQADPANPPQLAVDSLGNTHLFYPVGATVATTTHHHAMYRSGEWIQREPIDADQLLVDQGPDGSVWVLAAKTLQNGPFTSYLSAGGVGAAGFIEMRGLWWANFSKASYGLSVGTDGIPTFAFVKDAYSVRHTRIDTPTTANTLDVGSVAANAVATTGNVDAVVFASDTATGVMAFRHQGAQGDVFRPTGELAARAIESIDATMDADGNAHACAIAGGTVRYVRLSAAGTQTSYVVGHADQCWVGLDDDGAVHILIRTGGVIKHAMR